MQLIVHNTKEHIQRSRHLCCERFCACFVLTFATRRGHREKREVINISKQSTQNLGHHKYLDRWNSILSLSLDLSPFTSHSLHISVPELLEVEKN